MYVIKDDEGNIVSYFSEPMDGAEKVDDEADPKIISFKEKMKDLVSNRKSIEKYEKMVLSHYAAELLKDNSISSELKTACEAITSKSEKKSK